MDFPNRCVRQHATVVFNLLFKLPIIYDSLSLFFETMFLFWQAGGKQAFFGAIPAYPLKQASL